LTSNARQTSAQELIGHVDSEMPLAEAGSALFGEFADRSFGPIEACPEARYAGELISTRTNAGIMPQVRRLVSLLAGSKGSLVIEGPDRRLDCAGAAQVIADLIASEATSGQRFSLIRFAIKASPQERASLLSECRLRGDPAISTIARLLCGETRVVIDLLGLDAALTLAGDAETYPETRPFAAPLVSRVRRELAAFLRSQMLLTESMLRALVGSDALSAMTAAVAEEDSSVAARLSNSAAVVELLGPEGSALACAVRQRLAPRNGTPNDFRRGPASELSDQVRALSVLISAEPLEPRDVSQHASALACRLIEQGRRDLVIDAMRGVSARLSCMGPKTPADLSVEHRRLAVLISLAKALQDAPGMIETALPQISAPPRRRRI
jgi:hypothetical protein